MLTIARTFMGNPKLLLLDELLQWVAPAIVEQIADTILKIRKEELLVLIPEQNLHFAKIVVDRAVIIEGGTSRFKGTFVDLEAIPDARDKYLPV